MDQLYCIYRSIEKSICSTISASFPSACIVSFLAFISYMVFRLFFSLHKNRSKNFSGVSDMVYQGVWTAIFTFYTYMVLFRTWIARKRWEDPLDKIFGGWGLYTEKGNLTIEAIENVMLLFPFTFLLGILLRKRWKKYSPGSAFRYLALSGFFMSLTIETVQLLLKRGTFQFSDLFYNTTGGILGGAFYLTIRRLRFKICACKWQSKHKK